MTSYYSQEMYDKVDKALDPMNCPLHMTKLTGSICYSINSDGEYPVGAPPCNGCSIGITEAAAITKKSKDNNTVLRHKE
jgi:hypothetical protein